MLYDEEQQPFEKDLVSVKGIMDYFNNHSMVSGTMRGASPNVITRFLREIGAKNLGQKRIDGKKPRLWAIRRQDLWGQADEKTLKEHLDPASDYHQRRQEAFSNYLSVEAEGMRYPTQAQKQVSNQP
jgi:hypothetical protein